MIYNIVFLLYNCFIVGVCAMEEKELTTEDLNAYVEIINKYEPEDASRLLKYYNKFLETKKYEKMYINVSLDIPERVEWQAIVKCLSIHDRCHEGHNTPHYCTFVLLDRYILRELCGRYHHE